MGGMASISPPPNSPPFFGFIHLYTRWVYDKQRFIVNSQYDVQRYMNYVQTIHIYNNYIHWD